MSVYPTGQGNVNASAQHVNTPPASSQPDQPSDDSRIDPVVEILGAGRIVAHRVDLALAVGSTTAGLLLSQFWFWSNTPTAQARDGWFYMTADEISDQTGLSREEQMTARKRLVKLGIVEEDKRGTPMKLWFHVKKAELLALLREYAETKSKLWAIPKDELSGLPKDEHSGSPTVGHAQTYLSGMPKDRFGQLRKIASGKAQGLLSEKPKDITEMSSSTSSSISLESPESEVPDTSINEGDTESSPDSVANPATLLWGAALVELAERVNKPTLETHLAKLKPISFEDAVLILSAPSAFTRDWVGSRHRELIEEVAATLACEPVSVRFTVAGEGSIIHA